VKLNNIRMINSGNFSTANLLLDANSIQLAGRNNRGKTSLLWTLLFLFVVDRKKANHPDYQLKESLHFYFNKPEKSYIVFEGFDEKQGYFYMLLKRDDDTIKYYFVKRRFKEEFLIKNGEVLSFHEVLENPQTGIGTPLRDVTEILAKTITSKKGEVGFLRLEKNINSKRFSELYKHLFNIGKNDDNILKNGILVVLGLKDEKIDFGNEIGHSERTKWEREKREIEGLKKVKERLDFIKDKRNIYEASRVKLKVELIKYELINFDQVLQNIEKESSQFSNDIESKNNELIKIEENKDIKNTKHLECIKLIATKETLLSQSLKNLKEAESYGEEIWLKQEILNATTEREKLNKILQNLQNVKSKEEIEIKLFKVNKSKQYAENYINNNENLLLMNISTSKEDIAITNALLSEEVKTLSKDKILKSASSFSTKSFSYNGVDIDISEIDPVEVPTKEEKEQEVQELVSEIETLTEMLKRIVEKDTLKKEYEESDKKVDKAKNKLEEVKNIYLYQEQILTLNELIEKEKKNKDYILDIIQKQEDQTKLLFKDIEEAKIIISELRTNGDEIFQFKTYFSMACKFAEMENVTVKDFERNKVIEKIRSDSSLLTEAVTLVESTLFDFEQSLELAKNELRGVIGVDKDTPDDFISILDEKCYGLDVREEEFGDMVKAGCHIFFQRIKRFLAEVETIKTYVNRINRTISHYKISDLSNVKINSIINEDQVAILKSINGEDTDLFFSFDDRYEDLPNSDDFFGEYLRKDKVVKISDLFNIDIEREKNNIKESSKQSNGTERMLHVMLLLILMREMINREDTIPFLIDEVADIDYINQAQLLTFFKELNLLPISASPQVSHEFEKVYRIEDINGKSYLSNSTSTWKEKDLEENGKVIYE